MISSPKIGDLIIDPETNSMGILVEKKRKIYITDEEAYYWMIHWFLGSYMPPYIEENYLIVCLENGILVIPQEKK